MSGTWMGRDGVWIGVIPTPECFAHYVPGLAALPSPINSVGTQGWNPVELGGHDRMADRD